MSQVEHWSTVLAPGYQGESQIQQCSQMKDAGEYSEDCRAVRSGLELTLEVIIGFGLRSKCVVHSRLSSPRLLAIPSIHGHLVLNGACEHGGGSFEGFLALS